MTDLDLAPAAPFDESALAALFDTAASRVAVPDLDLDAVRARAVVRSRPTSAPMRRGMPPRPRAYAVWRGTLLAAAAVVAMVTSAAAAAPHPRPQVPVALGEAPATGARQSTEVVPGPSGWVSAHLVTTGSRTSSREVFPTGLTAAEGVSAARGPDSGAARGALVGLGRVVVAVPDGWSTTFAGCAASVAAAGQEGLLAASCAEGRVVGGIQLVPDAATAFASPPLFRLGQRPIRVTCARGGTCESVLRVPGQRVRVRVFGLAEHAVAEIIASVRIITGAVGVPPPRLTGDPASAARAFAAASPGRSAVEDYRRQVEALGLRLVVDTPALIDDGRTEYTSVPAPGTVVPEGTVVHLTAVRR